MQLVLVWLIYTLSIGPMYWTWFGGAYVDGSYWVASGTHCDAGGLAPSGGKFCSNCGTAAG